MEGDFQSGKSINTTMNSCSITNLWASVQAMEKDLFIDLDKQEITKLFTGKKLNPFLWGSRKEKELKYYAITYCKNNKRNNLLLHRLFFYWHHGYLPKLVDHKDTNPQNNNIENLREINGSGNKRNSKKKKNCTSKYKGVSFNKQANKWESKLMLYGKRFFSGYFDNEDDAGQAYNDKIRELGLEEVSVMNDTPQERATK